jgi:hypothetical protein
MNYNTKRTAAGQVMPLLMGCTMPQAIEAEPMEEKIIYDPVTQKVVMDLRILGTRCLKVHSTTKKNNFGTNVTHQDKKNEIDDQKSVR